MENLAVHGFTVFMGFFAIMNPVANTPVFIGLTAGDDRQAKRLVARNSVLLAFGVTAVFCLAGKLVFELFGISLPALRITGGVVVFLIGFHMLQGELSPVHNPSGADTQKSLDAELSVAISPLAVPILAGPGTIATAMNYSASGGVANLVVTIAAFGVLCLVTYAFFLFGERFIQYIGENAIKVITRLMGLILAVIGSQMLIQGIYGAVRSFR
jgi:multiple antibiotic resistance protein